MSNTSTPVTTLEFDVSQGPFFPDLTSIAGDTGLSDAVTTVQGEAASQLTLAQGTASSAGVTLTFTQGASPGDVNIDATIPPATAGVGTAFPATAIIGQLFFRTDIPGLYIWTGTWQAA